MRTSLNPGRSLALLLMLFAVIGCDKPPAGPTTFQLEVTVPSTVAPGATVRFTATIRESNGSSRDVTREATWKSSNPAALTIDAAGAATGVANGETIVSAEFDGARRDREVMVLPDGTFRLTGRVRERGSSGLSGAQISARAGGTVLSTTSGASGDFLLYGLRGDVTLTVTRASFLPIEQVVVVLSHESIDLQMDPEVPYPNLGGLHDLRLQADGSCVSVLPREALARTYTAEVVQKQSGLVVTLTGAVFEPVEANAFDGRFSGASDLKLWFYQNAWGDAPYPNVSERIGPTLVLTLTGVASLTVKPGGAEGVLDGALTVFDSSTQPPQRTACHGAHSLTLRPRLTGQRR